MIRHTHTVTLQGGPLEGHEREISSRMDTEFPVDCPWGGPMFHFARARYRPDGRWVETACSSTETGEPLKATPDGADEWPPPVASEESS